MDHPFDPDALGEVRAARGAVKDGAAPILYFHGGGWAVCNLQTHMPLMAHLSFNFPELNLVLLAAILGMGQYTGYKLSELYRFRAMDEL